MTCDQEETHVISFDTLPCVKRYGRTNIRTGGDKKYTRLQRHESCTREINRHRDVKPNHYDFFFRNKLHVFHNMVSMEHLRLRCGGWTSRHCTDTDLSRRLSSRTGMHTVLYSVCMCMCRWSDAQRTYLENQVARRVVQCGNSLSWGRRGQEGF